MRDRHCDAVTDRVPMNLSYVYIFCDNFLDDRDNSDFDDREGGRYIGCTEAGFDWNNGRSLQK